MGALGLVCALFGEAFQRIFYAHGDTHWDPPAAAIVFGTLLIAVLYGVGLVGTTVWIPLPLSTDSRSRAVQLGAGHRAA